MRDLTFAAVLLLSFSAYLTPSIDEGAVLGV